MKNPSLLKIVSALKKRTNPINVMVPTEGGLEGQTASEIETSYERSRRSLGQLGSITDVIKRREKEKERGFDKHGKEIKSEN